MPELPEVEISRMGIDPWVSGHTILSSEVRNVNLRSPVSEEIILLRNQRVLGINRRAKYLLLELSDGWIIIHLGMSGCLRVLLHSQPPKKHDHVDLIMSNGCTIRYTDPRRFGSWLWSKDIKTSHVLANLGIEPLSDEFNGAWLYQKSRNKRKAIKPWLMDNKQVVGIGNIYASESMFVAGILPSRPAGSLSEKDSRVLSASIKLVLLQSISQGGTTLRDFFQHDGQLGYFAYKLQVYGRAGLPCLICNTLIKTTKHVQRSTFFCPTCQH